MKFNDAYMLSTESQLIEPNGYFLLQLMNPREAGKTGYLIGVISSGGCREFTLTLMEGSMVLAYGKPLIPVPMKEQAQPCSISSQFFVHKDNPLVGGLARAQFKGANGQLNTNLQGLFQVFPGQMMVLYLINPAKTRAYFDINVAWYEAHSME